MYTTAHANNTIINFCKIDILLIPNLFVTESKVLTVDDVTDDNLEPILDLELDVKVDIFIYKYYT
jgi:hypothetical protein